MAQSCRREVLLETRGALQRLLQPRKPAEILQAETYMFEGNGLPY